MKNSLSRQPFVCKPIAIQTGIDVMRANPNRTALREFAYITRDRFEWGDDHVVDFTKRSEDLFMRATVLPDDAPAWMTSGFLRWKLADDAADATGRPDTIRAWHIVADLPPSGTKGEWMDQAERLVRKVLPKKVVVDIAGHIPLGGTPPHIHVLASACFGGIAGYTHVAYPLYRRLNNCLQDAWLQWLRH